MTKDQINAIKALDINSQDGTIQSVLIGDNLHEIPYVKVLEFLVSTLKKEKDFLVEQNIQLSKGINSLEK